MPVVVAGLLSLAVASTVPPAPPPGLAELAGALMSAEEIGVPVDWAIRDLDPLVALDDALRQDTDPFLGLLVCPSGTIREESDSAWLSRRFSAPELPLEDGLLSVEIIAEIESSEAAADDRDVLDACEPTEFGELSIDETELPGIRSPATTIQLVALPTADVPYPSAFRALIVNDHERTITVVLGGIDMGADSWQKLAEDIAVQVLEAVQA